MKNHDLNINPPGYLTKTDLDFDALKESHPKRQPYSHWYIRFTKAFTQYPASSWVFTQDIPPGISLQIFGCSTGSIRSGDGSCFMVHHVFLILKYGTWNHHYLLHKCFFIWNDKDFTLQESSKSKNWVYFSFMCFLLNLEHLRKLVIWGSPHLHRGLKSRRNWYHQIFRKFRPGDPFWENWEEYGRNPPLQLGKVFQENCQMFGTFVHLM